MTGRPAGRLARLRVRCLALRASVLVAAAVSTLMLGGAQAGGLVGVQSTSLFTPCISSSDGTGSTNYFVNRPGCQNEGPAWTIASEMESAGGGVPCTSSVAPLMQSAPINVQDGAITESTSSKLPYTISIGQSWANVPLPKGCSSGADVWSWVGLLDHNPGATQGGIVSHFGNVRGTPLPSPYMATESFQVAFADFVVQGQNDQAYAEFGGIWAGCYNLVEVSLSDRGDTLSTGPVSIVWHEASWPAVSSGCFNYVGLNGSYLLNGGKGFIPPLHTVPVVLKWGNIISYLQGLTGCPSGTVPGGCADTSPATRVLPMYGKGAVSDIVGVGEQTMQPTADIGSGQGPTQLMSVTDVAIYAQLTQKGFGSL